MLDGPFNDVHPWQFSKIPDVLGQGRGFVVETEGQLDEALRQSERASDTFCVLDVRLERYDSSPALRRLSARMAKQVSESLSTPGGAVLGRVPLARLAVDTARRTAASVPSARPPSALPTGCRTVTVAPLNAPPRPRASLGPAA